MQITGTKIALFLLLLLSSVASRAQSVVQIINGGTGSSTVPAANGALGIPGPKVNVLGYGAKADCSTDNQTALIAAENAANATNPAGVLYFPHGCYLTSTLPWYGLSMEGEAPVGINPPEGNAGVIIKGMPGEDIFEAPDPTTVTTAAPRQSWSIRDIVFEVDDSVDASASFPHRLPGRSVQDAGMTSGSAVFTSPHSVISCGDVGQAIQVNGAGPGGANLVTTISSVVPCAANAIGQTPTITLAAAASTTVTTGTGTAYISVAGLSATQTVGNAALAMDCYDGNSAHYTMAGTPQNVEDEMTNVKFYGLSNASLNHSAGIFIQGCYAPYDLTVNHGDLYVDFGAVFVPAQLDSYQSQGLQDYPTWNGGTWEGSYPWISYDGGDGSIGGIQVYDNGWGPQILNSGVYTGDTVTGWTINAPETEGLSPNYGWRIEGSEYHLTNTYLGGGVGGTVGPIWDAVDSTCANCGWLGTPQINGSRNHIDFTGSLQTQQPIDNGIGNQITYRGFNPSGASASRSSNLTQTIFDQPVGARTADSFRNGNAGLYPSDNDLVFGPVDFINFGISDSAAEISVDSTAFFGKALAVKNATPYVYSFYSMLGVNYSGNGEAVIGTEVPLTKAQVIFGFKCAASATINLTVQAIPSYATLGTDSPSCHTGWTTDALPVDFTSYSGQGFGFGVTSSSNDAMIEFVAIRPYQHDYNGKQPVLSATPIGTTGSGVAVPTGPTTSSNNDVAGFTGTNGQLQDLGFAYTAYPAADIAVGSLASGMAATTQLIGDTSTDLSTDAFVHNVVNAAILTGTTGTITGTSLSATCDSGTASVTGAVVGSPVAVSSTTGADVGGAFYLRASVTSTGTVTVYVCGTGTPSSLAYNVVVF